MINLGSEVGGRVDRQTEDEEERFGKDGYLYSILYIL